MGTVSNERPTQFAGSILFQKLPALLWRGLHLPLWGMVGTLWLLGGCAAGWAPLSPVTTVPTDCPLHIPDDLVEGETIFCGFLQVPQNRANPTGLQIALPYARIRAESAHPDPEPLIYIAGGPGGSALAEFSALYPRLRPLRRDRDLVFYDQRGTILAEPALDCELNTPPRTADALDAAIAAAEAQTPALYHPLDAHDAAIAACAAKLHAAGVDLAFYDTTTHARDLIDLAHALGYPRYHLYGASYGTRIALEAMRLAAPGLTAVVLDAVDPPQVDSYVAYSALATWEVVEQMWAACAADPVCVETFPAAAKPLRSVLGPIVDDLDAAPLLLPLNWQPQFNGRDLLQLLLVRFEPALAAYLPRLLDDLARRETGTLIGVLEGRLPPPPSLPPASATVVESAAATEFLLDLNGAVLLRLGELDAAAQTEWLRLSVRNADRPRLVRFIRTYLPDEVAQALLRQLAELDDGELAQVFAKLNGLPAHPLTTGANLAVECRDEVPFNDYVAVMNAHRRIALPDAVVAQKVEELRHFWAQCALFPTGAAPLSQSEPVISPIPTLILQGALDGVTPPSWARLAQQSLRQSHYVEFPGQGHIVLNQPLGTGSGCPLQIIRSFLADPTTPPDTGCVQTVYAPVWALPTAP
jgi:pimeloyl-ACP methyl ester carboxylesterase